MCSQANLSLALVDEPQKASDLRGFEIPPMVHDFPC